VKGGGHPHFSFRLDTSSKKNRAVFREENQTLLGRTARGKGQIRRAEKNANQNANPTKGGGEPEYPEKKYLHRGITATAQEARNKGNTNHLESCKSKKGPAVEISGNGGVRAHRNRQKDEKQIFLRGGKDETTFRGKGKRRDFGKGLLLQREGGKKDWGIKPRRDINPVRKKKKKMNSESCPKKRGSTRESLWNSFGVQGGNW